MLCLSRKVYTMLAGINSRIATPRSQPGSSNNPDSIPCVQAPERHTLLAIVVDDVVCGAHIPRSSLALSHPPLGLVLMTLFTSTEVHSSSFSLFLCALPFLGLNIRPYLPTALPIVGPALHTSLWFDIPPA